MRWLLNVANFLGLCAIAPYWLWKMPQARRYRCGLLERLGFVPRRQTRRRRLWVHTVSVGEAAIPRDLVALFREEYPGWEVVFSTATDTGLDRLRKLYPGSSAFYWPLDLSPCVDRALDRIGPDAVVLVELELWPNFQLACAERRIPVMIVNGRINPGSAVLLRVLSRLQPAVWGAVAECCARSPEDARRFVRAGLARERTFCTGSLKYDTLALAPDAARLEALRKLFALAPGAPVLVAGSTHPGEEEVLCRIHLALMDEYPDLRLVLVPRHIERASALDRKLTTDGVKVLRKTLLDEGRRTAAGDEVILVDTIGDLPACWSLATCAFVGRSLCKPGGGQNMMEPAALGRPVIVGPHTGNFRPEMQLLNAREAVVVVDDEEQLEAEFRRLLSDRQAAALLGERSRRAIMESQGATGKTMAHLERVIGRAGGS